MRAVILACCLAIASPAAAQLSHRGHLRLPLQTENMGERSFGTVAAVVARLRRIDHSCIVDTYDYGGSINCGARPGAPGTARVLIGFHSVPTRGPDRAVIDEVRMNGVDGGFVPAADQERVVQDFLRDPRASLREGRSRTHQRGDR